MANNNSPLSKSYNSTIDLSFNNLIENHKIDLSLISSTITALYFRDNAAAISLFSFFLHNKIEDVHIKSFVTGPLVNGAVTSVLNHFAPSGVLAKSFYVATAIALPVALFVGNDLYHNQYSESTNSTKEINNSENKYSIEEILNISKNIFISQLIGQGLSTIIGSIIVTKSAALAKPFYVATAIALPVALFVDNDLYHNQYSESTNSTKEINNSENKYSIEEILNISKNIFISQLIVQGLGAIISSIIVIKNIQNIQFVKFAFYSTAHILGGLAKSYFDNYKNYADDKISETVSNFYINKILYNYAYFGNGIIETSITSGFIEFFDSYRKEYLPEIGDFIENIVKDDILPVVKFIEDQALFAIEYVNNFFVQENQNNDL